VKAYKPVPAPTVVGAPSPNQLAAKSYF